MVITFWLVTSILCSIFYDTIKAHPPVCDKKPQRLEIALFDKVPQEIFNIIAQKLLISYASVPHQANPIKDNIYQEVVEKKIKNIFDTTKYPDSDNENDYRIDLAQTLLYIDAALLVNLMETSKAFQEKTEAFIDLQRKKIVSNDGLCFSLEYDKYLLDCIGYNRHTFLHYAVCSEWTYVIESLVAYGIPINAQNKDGKTVLHECITSVPMLTLLILRGADVNAQDKWRQTPLHYAAAFSHDFITHLVKSGARADIQDWFGNTPFNIAEQRGASEAERTLLKS